MSTLILTTLAVVALGSAVSTADASGSGWGCRTCTITNGTQLTGIALGKASTGTVSAVILPSGEILDLR